MVECSRAGEHRAFLQRYLTSKSAVKRVITGMQVEKQYQSKTFIIHGHPQCTRNVRIE